MLKHVNVDLEVLSREGKRFKWSRPPPCKCGHIFWGHGYVARYFDGYSEKLWLKKWRCPLCRSVITFFPNGYIKFVQASLETIFKALRERLSFYKWPPWTTRQRAAHWLRRLKKYCVSNFGVNTDGYDLEKHLLILHEKKINFFV
jgi:hypothetical protein